VTSIFSWGIVESGPNAPLISENSPEGRVSAQLRDGILWISLEDEPAGDCLVGVFRRGIAAGWIKPSMPALVDLTRFIGSVDWAAIRTVRTMAPWGTGPSGDSLVAYIVRSSLFGTLIEVASALFVNAQHRAFTNEAEALDWLRQPNRPPPCPAPT